MAKRALVTGVSGQDGSYLAELLLDEGYEVYGFVRRLSLENYDRIEHILDKITLVEGDLLDEYSIMDAVSSVNPDEIYNLAAQSFVPTSFAQPMLTAHYDGLGPLRWLEAIRRLKPDTRFYQASTSEMFGKVREVPQRETTPFYPRSPYGVAKVYAYFITVNYRESYGLHASNGILFNHESPRRGLMFVSRKITDGVARIKHGLDTELRLGNLEAKRDWGFAGDSAKAMWLMLQQDEPDDYVIAMGHEHSVREFCEIAFSRVGLDYNDYVVVDPAFYRPAEVERLLGDPTKAREKLGWEDKVSFEDMVAMMVDADMERYRKAARNA
ncbi:MAG: GDP-mannose 4,6-dehydratase [Coriobacteriales bacterium]|nr:GDP-mannose 4,6-dehydratase [Coriobacteriales bacterium]